MNDCPHQRRGRCTGWGGGVSVRGGSDVGSSFG